MRRRRGRVGVETRPEPSPRAALAVTAGELAEPATAPSLDSRWVWHLTPPCPPVWQQPFLNVFRHFKVDEWKRSSKEGDVAVVTVSGPGRLAAGAAASPLSPGPLCCSAPGAPWG